MYKILTQFIGFILLVYKRMEKIYGLNYCVRTNNFGFPLSLSPSGGHREIVKSVFDSKKIIFILVGLPGCGKSTFANNLVEAVRTQNPSAPSLIRISQDDVGTRKRVIKTADNHLAAGGSVIIDRCNFSFTQRKYFTDLARSHRASTVCVQLPNFDDVIYCSNRAILRGNDGVHTPDTDWFAVCSRVYSELQPPNTLNEDIDHLIVLAKEAELDALSFLHRLNEVFMNQNLGERK